MKCPQQRVGRWDACHNLHTLLSQTSTYRLKVEGFRSQQQALRSLCKTPWNIMHNWGSQEKRINMLLNMSQPNYLKESQQLRQHYWRLWNDIMIIGTGIYLVHYWKKNCNTNDKMLSVRLSMSLDSLLLQKQSQSSLTKIQISGENISQKPALGLLPIQILSITSTY